MLSKEFIEEMKQKLVSEKERLTVELSGLNPNEHLGEDLDSNVQEVEDNEVSQDVIARLKADLEKIDKALFKIEQGTYGMDEQGHEISEDRLRVIPWADKAI